MWRSVPEIKLLGVPEVYQARETTSGLHFLSLSLEIFHSGKWLFVNWFCGSADG